MISQTTKSFRRAFAQLPADVQDRAREAFRLFSADPSYPGLQFKKVHGTRPVYSARISKDYRAVCVLRGGEATWFFIGSHANYDRLLKTL